MNLFTIHSRKDLSCGKIGMKRKTMKIHVLHCGYIRVADCIPSGGKNVAAELRRAMATPDNRRVTLPVSVYLIEHKSGLYLVDTGWCRDISPEGVYSRKAAESVLPSYLARLYHPYVPQGMAVHEQLESMGIRQEDIAAVLITHFDADHVAGLKHLSKVSRRIMPEEERYWAVRTKYSIRQPENLWDFPGTEYPYYRGFLIGPDDRAVDITGDESLMMIKLSGHTDGQAGILIREGGRYVLLAADAAYSPDNWKTMTPPGLGADRGSQLRTLEWLSKTAADPSCVKVLCSHDPEVRPGVIEI